MILRPFHLSDAPRVKELAGARVIADTTLKIPHPYENGVAERWIGTHEKEFRTKRSVVFAVTRRGSGRLIGAIALAIDRENENAEMGYWIGKPYWNRGYATEAAEVILMYGFTELGLNKIHAHHFNRNPASGKVLQNIGMRREGVLRRHVKKWDAFEDITMYGILRSEYQPA